MRRFILAFARIVTESLFVFLLFMLPTGAYTMESVFLAILLIFLDYFLLKKTDIFTHILTLKTKVIILRLFIRVIGILMISFLGVFLMLAFASGHDIPVETSSEVSITIAGLLIANSFLLIKTRL